MPSVFSRIIAGELPGRFVWRDADCVAFLTINPLQPGHTLVVPRREVDHWLDLDEPTARHLMSVSQVVGRAQQAAFACERVGLIIAGFEVPHTHLHVIPMEGMHHLSFANAAASVSAAELEGAASAIRVQLVALGRPEVSLS